MRTPDGGSSDIRAALGRLRETPNRTAKIVILVNHSIEKSIFASDRRIEAYLAMN
jgi:hypothetical protein